MRAYPALTGLALLATTCIMPPKTFAQDAPNVEQITRSLTRGIRLATPDGDAIQQAVTPVPSISLNIHFETGSAVLTPEAARLLDELAQALKTPALAADRFRIEGHTDTAGSRALNQTLSEERAAQVVNYLASRHGIERGRLQAVGLGKDGLLVQTRDETPEIRNRRVLVVNIGDTSG